MYVYQEKIIKEIIKFKKPIKENYIRIIHSRRSTLTLISDLDFRCDNCNITHKISFDVKVVLRTILHCTNCGKYYRWIYCPSISTRYNDNYYRLCEISKQVLFDLMLEHSDFYSIKEI